jgi:uncharacterized repeat protein (TIGR03803 family)
MTTRFTVRHTTASTCAKTHPVPGWKPYLPLLMRLLWAAALALPTFNTHAAVVLTTLCAFTNRYTGVNPLAGLVQGSDGNFYGTTEYGGNAGPIFGSDNGTVFKITTNGTLTTLYSFGTVTNVSGYPQDGANPIAGLVQGSDGSFYGTTESGGTNDAGTVFKITTNGVLTTLYSFGMLNNAEYAWLDGAEPVAGLVQASDGYLYGTTAYGGTNRNAEDLAGFGTVFKINTNGLLTTLYSFGTVTTNYPGFNSGPVDGANPAAGLVQASDGNFYGTTQSGGANPLENFAFGTVFKITTNGTLTTIHSFGAVFDSEGYAADGENSTAGLVQGSDGNFYGTTEYGGNAGSIFGSSYGTVFKITTNGTLTTLYSFGTVTNVSGYPQDGANPVAGLVQGSDGSFYGTTESGGTNDAGTVFKITTNGVLTSLYSFTGAIYGNNGWSPQAGLVQGSDGNFYGTTEAGGGTFEAPGSGTVFQMRLGLSVMRAAPEFQAVTLVNGKVNLAWSTEAGGVYQLQHNSDLSSSNWTDLGNPITAAGATISTIDSITNGPQRFYRLVLLR